MSITQLIKDFLNKEQLDRSKRERSGKINPSSFGQCYRRQYWNWIDEPKTNLPNERVLAIFKCGHLFEDFLFSVLPNTIEKQVLVETEDCKGYADGVDEEDVIECKSQNSRKFWHVEKEKKENPDFTIADHNIDHVLQGMFYVRELNKKYLRLIYVSKDDLCTSEYKLALNGWAEKVQNEIDTLKEFRAKNELPPAKPRLYGIDKYTNKPKECGYCAWADKCKQREGV